MATVPEISLLTTTSGSPLGESSAGTKRSTSGPESFVADGAAAKSRLVAYSTSAGRGRIAQVEDHEAARALEAHEGQRASVDLAHHDPLGLWALVIAATVEHVVVIGGVEVAPVCWPSTACSIWSPLSHTRVPSVDQMVIAAACRRSAAGRCRRPRPCRHRRGRGPSMILSRPRLVSSLTALPFVPSAARDATTTGSSVTVLPSTSPEPDFRSLMRASSTKPFQSERASPSLAVMR